VPLLALLRVLREHLAINPASTKHVPNGVTEDRIGHTNDIEVNVWSVALGKLARVEFRIPAREIFSDHDVSSLCCRGWSMATMISPICSLLSINRCASTIFSNGKVFAIIGFSLPLASPPSL
jgi:hypothetical protein